MRKERVVEYKDLTPEQREQARACQTPQELLELSRKIGYSLSEEELDAINGGALWSCSDDVECSPYVCTNVCASGSARDNITGGKKGLM